MAFTRFPDPTNNISNLANQPVEPPATLKQKFDQIGEDLKDWNNNTFLPELESTTNGDSGADNIGATALSGGVATTVQGIVEELDTKVGSGVSALNTHKSSSDHDGRYYTEAELNAGQLDTRYFTEAETTSLLLANQQGNHLGTWQGYSPVQSDPGIQAIVNEHTVLISDLQLQRKGPAYSTAIFDMFSDVPEESLYQIRNSINLGSVKIAFVGDSITEGYDQTNLKDNYVERFMRNFKEKFPNVTVNYTNFALTGRTLENFVSPTFHDYSLVGDDLCQTRTWVTDQNKVWREYVKDYQPDLLFIAFGVNDSAVTKPNGEFIDKYFIDNLEYFRTQVLNTYAKMPSICLVTSLLGTTVEADAIAVFGYMPSEIVTQSLARATRHYAKNKNFALADANRLWLIARDGKDDVKRASVWERNFEDFNTSMWVGDKSSFSLLNNTITQNVNGKFISRDKFFYEGSIEMDITPLVNGAGGVLYVIIRNDVDLGGLLWDVLPSSVNGVADGNIVLYKQNSDLTTVGIGTSANIVINTGTSYKVKFETVGSKHVCYINGVNVLEAEYYGAMHDGFVTFGSPNKMPTISNLYLSFEDQLVDTSMYSNADLIGLPPYTDKSESGDGLHHPTGLGYAVAYQPSVIAVLNNIQKNQEITLPVDENWIAPTLLNGWVNFGGGEETAGYYKDNFGVVHLKGSIKSGTDVSNTTLFTLPVGYRPSSSKIFSAVSNSLFGAIGVQANGNVVIVTGSNVVFSFDGVTFRV